MANMDLILPLLETFLGGQQQQKQPQPPRLGLPNIGGTQNDLMYRETSPMSGIQPLQQYNPNDAPPGGIPNLPPIGADPIHGDQTAVEKYGQAPPLVGAPPPAATPLPDLATAPIDNSVIDPNTGGATYAPDLALPRTGVATEPLVKPPALGADPAAVDELMRIGDAARRGIPSTDTASVDLPPIGERSLEGEYAETTDPTQFDRPIYRKIGTKETTHNENEAKSWAEGYETVREGGAKRNKKWSLLEKIGAAVTGWAGGGLVGGIKAATDRNYFQKIKNDIKREELLPQIAAKQKIDLSNATIRDRQNQTLARSIKTEADVANIGSQINRRTGQNAADAARLQHDRELWKAQPAADQLKSVMETYRHLKSFKKDGTAEEREMYAIAKKNKVPMPDKDDTTPEKGGVDLDEKTIHAALQIDDDETLKNRAASKVYEKAPSTYYDPTLVNALPREIRNPDGSFNLDMFNKAKNDPLSPYHDRVKGTTLESILSKAPDDYKQRHASEIERIRGEQKDLRSEAAILRTALKTHRPNRPDAPVETSAAVFKFFKDIMSQPAGDKRKKDLEAFYQTYLPSIRIQ